MYRSWTSPGHLLPLALALAFVTAALPGCAPGSGSDPEPATPNVVLFTTAEAVKTITGETVVAPRHLFPYTGSRQLVYDLASRSILLLESDGTPFPFASRDALTNATGEATVDLGPMDRILAGPQAEQVVMADSISGVLLRIDTLGRVIVHATQAQITAVTGESDAEASRPRVILDSQIIAQDLVSGDILLFDGSGNAQPFVGVSVLATTAGIAASEAIVAGWEKGNSTGSQYAWFNSTNTIVRVQTNSSVNRAVAGAELDALVPDIATPRILGLAAPVGSDDLWVLVGTVTGNVARGLAVLFVPENGAAASVFTSQATLAALLGAGFDLAEFGFIDTGGGSAFFGVDRASSQVLTFTASNGAPSIIGKRADVETATGVASPRLGPSASLRATGLVVFDSTSQRHILVR